MSEIVARHVGHIVGDYVPLVYGFPRLLPQSFFLIVTLITPCQHVALFLSIGIYITAPVDPFFSGFLQFAVHFTSKVDRPLMHLPQTLKKAPLMKTTTGF